MCHIESHTAVDDPVILPDLIALMARGGLLKPGFGPPCLPRRPVKIPRSVLVVIVDEADDFLLIERADAREMWQSVTGSVNSHDEELAAACVREVREETGIDVSMLAADALIDLKTVVRFEIFDRWRHRYAPGVTHNEEHAFMLRVPTGTRICLNPREHVRFRWAQREEAARCCFSPSNRDAILRVGSAA